MGLRSVRTKDCVKLDDEIGNKLHPKSRKRNCRRSSDKRGGCNVLYKKCSYQTSGSFNRYPRIIRPFPHSFHQLSQQDLSHGEFTSETYQKICIFILISGVFLVLWTIFGWILYVRKSTNLHTTSGTSNIVLLLLVYFLFLSNQIPVIFLIGATFSFLLTFLHILFLGLLKIFSKLQVHHKNKDSMHSLI